LLASHFLVSEDSAKRPSFLVRGTAVAESSVHLVYAAKNKGLLLLLAIEGGIR
jgi:hypothetical protein